MFDLFGDADIWRLMERLGFARKRDRHADAIGNLTLGYQVSLPLCVLDEAAIYQFKQQLRALRRRGKLQFLSAEIPRRSAAQGKEWEYSHPQGHSESSMRQQPEDNQSIFTELSELDAFEMINFAHTAVHCTWKERGSSRTRRGA